MNRYSHTRAPGLTLIEAIFFIILVGVVTSTLLMSLNTSLFTIPATEMNQKAMALAQSRMEILLGQIKIQRTSAPVDICQNPADHAICLTDPKLEISTSIIPWQYDDRLNEIIISVNEPGQTTSLAQLRTLVGPQ